MSSEIRSFTINVPAGTTAAAPVEFDCSFPPRNVDGIEIIVPPGPNGNLGFYLANSGVTVIPYDSDDFIVSNDEKITWSLDSQVTSGSWQVFAYNTGVNVHTFYVRFLLSDPPEPYSSSDVAAASNAEISALAPVASPDDSGSSAAPFVTLS